MEVTKLFEDYPILKSIQKLLRRVESLDGAHTELIHEGYYYLKSRKLLELSRELHENRWGIE